MQVGPSREQFGGPNIAARPVHDVGVIRAVPDRLAEHGGEDALGGPLDQFEGKTATDAVAHEEEFADAEMVHQPQLVVGEGAPRVVDRDRAARFAAIRVALVHRDAAEVVL